MKFEELDYQQTPLGEVSLRRRAEPRLNGKTLYEVKLGDEFLMSSLFTQAEVELAQIGLSACSANPINVVVGGLGLGYTALACLQEPKVGSLIVVDFLKPIIDWHQKGLVPLGKKLTADPRCTLLHGDFFELSNQTTKGFNPHNESELADAVLLDIDHSPAHWLTPSNQSFYSESGLSKLAKKIKVGGIFGLWSNDAPDSAFVNLLESVFDNATAHIVNFPNPYSGNESSNTVYIAKTKAA